jgi:hypothetical protein
MTTHKIQVPVLVLTLARKRLFLRWALKGFRKRNLDREKGLLRRELVRHESGPS